MAVRSVTIRILTVGARRAAKGIAGVGKSAAKTAALIAALTVAISALVGVAGLIALARGTYKVSAQFELWDRRLRILLGSQTSANHALAEFNELTKQTPFSLAALMTGAQNLATVTNRSTKELLDLTEASANVAAVLDIPYEQAAANMARLAEEGIKGARAFKNRGLKALIEAAIGLEDLSKKTVAEQIQIIKGLFTGNGEYADAALELNDTLQGALDGVGNALTRLKKEIGDTFSPAIIAVARGAIIPFLDDLTTKVGENKDEWGLLLVEGIAKFVEKSGDAIDALAGLGDQFGDLNISVEDTIGWIKDLARVIELILLAIQSWSTGLTTLEVGIRGVGVLARGVLVGVGVRTSEELQESLDDLGEAAGRLTQKTFDLEAAFERFDRGARDRDNKPKKDLDDTTESAERAGDALRGVAEAIRKAGEEAIAARRARQALGTDVSGDPGGAYSTEVPEELQRNLEKLLRFERALKAAAADRIDPLRKEISLIEDKIKLAEEIELHESQEADRQRIINKLLDERNRLKNEYVGFQNEEERLTEKIGIQLEKLAGLDRERAIELGRQLESILETADGVEDLVEKLRDLQRDLKHAIEDATFDLAESIGDIVADGLKSGLRAALTGDETFDFAEFFADKLADLVLAAMDETINNIGDKLSELLENITGGAAGEGGFGGAQFGKSLGLAIGLVGSHFLRNREAEITSGVIESAVTSTQPVRGIVAGPTEIPIFQVANAIEDSFVETNSILRDILEAINRGGAAGGGAGASVEAEAARVIGTESPATV
jgi:hypothetical protein